MTYKRAIIIGGGHSTENLDWSLLQGEFTFGLNYAFKLLTPTTLVFDNDRFYNENKNAINKIESVKISHHCRKKGIIYIPGSKVYYGTKSLKKRAIYTYTLTGIYTLTLASCLPFEEIYLLGYDMNMDKGYLHNRHLKHPHNSLAPYRPQIGKFSHFANMENVYNVSPNSAIHVFPKLTLEEFSNIIKNDPQNITQEEARIWLKKHLLQG